MKALPTRWVTVLILFLVSGSAAEAQQRAPVFDAEHIITFGDADLDGRLSREEYRDFMRSSPRGRMEPDAIDSLFRRLDTDRDGFLSATEFGRSFRRPPDRPAAGPMAAEVPGEIAAFVDVMTPEQEHFFETKIRPVLAVHCGNCHGSEAEKLRGGLLVDDRESLRLGGHSGPAVVPGDPDESLLILAIRHHDPDLQMPPDEKLPDSVIADFEAWVSMGAPDPRTETAKVATHSDMKLDQGRAFWSFQPPRQSPPPEVRREDWPRNEIDRFLLAALESRGLAPVGDADRSRWLRRVSFDLIGLPPTPEELDAFLEDESPDARERVVDRLLDSPHFGERWGRHWLDVARYAESSGKTNFSYPQAWRYRDSVIAAFNADTPYNQFVREQIAGDLLPADSDRQRAEQLIATGFLALGSKAHDAEDRGQFVLDLVDEQIEATSRAFLGLTVACARCHDHKLDPIPQRDYYALSGIFRSTQTRSGTLAGVFPNFNASPLIELPPGAGLPSALRSLPPEQRAPMEERLAALIRERDSIPPGEANRDRQRRVNSMLATLRYRLAIDPADGPPRSFAMGVSERDQPVDSPLYIRGERDQPGAVVPRGLVQVLSTEETRPIETGSGRRELADWLASDANPLTARVMVNRVWLHLFGRGLVPTADNFGAAGQPPSHPELLDFLAVEFMEDGWSVKRLIRTILLSRAYGLDSSHDPANFEADPDNALVWRMSKRRLDAEALRDAMFFISGQLDLEPPVGSTVARTGEGLAMFLRVAGTDARDRHRSVYLPVVRDQVLESLALFDFADPSLVIGERAVTTGPAQALSFMNGPIALEQAEALADRINIVEGDAGRIDRAYRLALARLPAGEERDRALAFLRDFAALTSEREALVAFCQALFAGAEFRYLD